MPAILCGEDRLFLMAFMCVSVREKTEQAADGLRNSAGSTAV